MSLHALPARAPATVGISAYAVCLRGLVVCHAAAAGRPTALVSGHVLTWLCG